MYFHAWVDRSKWYMSFKIIHYKQKQIPSTRQGYLICIVVTVTT